MSGVNKVHLLGYLGGDPDMRRTGSGSRYARFSLATSETWRDQTTGKRRERTEWHQVVVWNEHLLRVVDDLRKGSRVWIVGANATRSWTDDKGVERFLTEVIIRGLQSDLQRVERIPGEREPGEGGGRRRDTPEPGGEDDYGHEREYEDA